MITEALKIFDTAKSPMELDTTEHIRPFVTEDVAKKIVDEKLTLAGCIAHCFKNGKQFEVKVDNEGTAAVTKEQHFAWCREYFGITADILLPKAGAFKPNLGDLFD